MRMPHIDLRNLLVDHSPWRFRHMHKRNFDRFIGSDRFRQPDALPLFVSVSRFRYGANVTSDARDVDDPLQLLLATNYLPPFYTHRPVIDGVAYGDSLRHLRQCPVRKSVSRGMQRGGCSDAEREKSGLGGIFKRKTTTSTSSPIRGSS